MEEILGNWRKCLEVVKKYKEISKIDGEIFYNYLNELNNDNI